LLELNSEKTSDESSSIGWGLLETTHISGSSVVLPKFCDVEPVCAVCPADRPVGPGVKDQLSVHEPLLSVVKVLVMESPG
jgi:hypothetical protein